MAKPIEATPTLRGKDAERFLLKMLEEERNPNPLRIATLRKAAKIKFEEIN